MGITINSSYERHIDRLGKVKTIGPVGLVEKLGFYLEGNRESWKDSE